MMNIMSMQNAKRVMHLSEPWFSLTKLNIKSVEVRIGKEQNAMLKVGDEIVFMNSDLKFERAISRKIVKIMKFATFKECLETVGISRCVPTIDGIGEALKVYYNYYSVEDEMLYGVIAFFLSME